MKLLSIIKTFFLFIYLFGSSVFFHTQAMWIQADGTIEWDCAMHNEMMWEMEMKTIPADSNCYEKCLWAYDDFSSTSYEVTANDFKVFDYHYSLTLYNSVNEISKISTYSKLIDWGWICSPPFVDRYIKITKKLE
jgi:hypothetical protein